MAAIHTLPVDDPDLRRAWGAAASVVDPEIPVLTVDDMGILRDVRRDAEGNVEVVITPTYSGCPAMNIIALDIEMALIKAGFENNRVTLVHTPAWTTDWLSDQAREKLRAYGIAPPDKTSTSKRALFAVDEVTCPKCGSRETERVSEFGSTACKALYRCLSCREPFDYFKCI